METISKNVDPLLCISVSMKKPYTEHQPESVQTCTHVFHFTADIGKDSSNLILRITRFSACCNLNVLNLGVTSPTPASDFGDKRNLKFDKFSKMKSF